MTSPRYSYRRWREGPDPLAPPVDLSEAIENVGREVMEGGSPRSGLEELLRRGTSETNGLDELTRQVWQRRARLQRSHRMDGTLQQVRELLDRAVDAEQETLQQEYQNAHGRDQAGRDQLDLDQARIEGLPAGTAAAVRELGDYRWHSTQAAQDYAEIEQLLGREALEAQFSGMKQALEHTGPEDAERVQQMLTDLNDLLAAHARGDDTTAQFDQFMSEHGQYFPENPRDTEELIDSLAARSAAAQRAMNSMSTEQRQELQQLAQQAFGSPQLAQQLERMQQQLQQLRPGEDRQGSQPMRGQQPLGMGQGTDLMEQLAELDQLAEQLSQSYPGASMADIDLEAMQRQLGEQAGVDAQRLAELERELRSQGILERAPDDGSLRLSPKALRRLGATALGEVVSALRATRGNRETAAAGAAGELTGSSRPWAFGDTEAWDVARTVRNAVLRNGSTGSAAVELDVTDVEITETEQLSRAAVAVCVDTSWSMVQEGRWLPMKRTALALHQLIDTRFRGDVLQLIGFGRYAQHLDLGELTGMEGTWEQGTNLHHALLLAGRHLRRHPDALPIVLVVTDGEPTAHLEPDGHAEFDYPPSARTLRVTAGEVDALARLGASLTIFRLGEDPRLAALLDSFARRSGGRVVAPDEDGLGAAVVSDYLRTRRTRAR